jgi:DNA polymerase III subunit beta
MKIVINTKALIEGLSLVEKVVGKKESLPVLSCIHLSTHQNTLELRATNLETAIRSSVGCSVEREGVCTIPAHILSSSIRSLRGDTVTLSLEDGILTISQKGARLSVKSIPHAEFPSLLFAGTGTQVILPTQILLKGITTVIGSVSPSLIRPELSSVFVSGSTQVIVFATTDSFRLSEARFPIETTTDFTLLIPSKNAQDLTHTLSLIKSETVTLIHGDNVCTITTPTLSFETRLTEGSFPNYSQIIPKESTTSATLLTGDILHTLKQARLYSGTAQKIGLHIYPSKSTFSTTAQSNEVGEMSEDLSAVLSGEDIDINVHCSYLLEGLSHIKTDSITITFGGANKPIVMRGVGDSTFMYLTMPLNR